MQMRGWGEDKAINRSHIETGKQTNSEGALNYGFAQFHCQNQSNVNTLVTLSERNRKHKYNEWEGGIP